MLGRHAVANRHAGVLATCLLLLLEVLIVGHLLLLLIGHIARVHARARHVGLGRIHIVVSDVLGSLGGDVGSVNAILARGRVGRIQASLDGDRVSGDEALIDNSKVPTGETYLDQVLALSLGDQRLQLGGGESIDKAGLRHDQQQHLSASKNRQFIRLDLQKCGLASARVGLLSAREGWISPTRSWAGEGREMAVPSS